MQQAQADTATLLIKPGPDEGSDAMVCFQQNDPVVANTNYGAADQMDIFWWTTGGAPFHTRGYIKFKTPQGITKNTKIISAKLLLYGMPGSGFMTQGNSYYPGSPYTSPNNLLVQQIVTDWNQDSITWNKQLGVRITQLNQVLTRTSQLQWNDNYEIDVTDMVKEMQRKKKNFGFRIKLETEATYRSVLFATSNNPDSSRWPAMRIKYTNQ